MKRAIQSLALAAALVGLLATSASAADKRDNATAQSPQAAGEVTFTITAIEATRNGKVDERLKPMSIKLVKSFKGHKGFKLLSRGVQSTTVGKTATFKLPGRRTLEVEYRGLRDGRVDVTTRLDGLETKARIRSGGMFFQAGRKQGKGVLVLAIQARAE